MKKTTQRQNLPNQPIVEILINTPLESMIGWKAVPFCKTYQVAIVKNGAIQAVGPTDRTYFKVPSNLIETEPQDFTVRGINSAGEGQWAKPISIAKPVAPAPPTPVPPVATPPVNPPATQAQPRVTRETIHQQTCEFANGLIAFWSYWWRPVLIAILICLCVFFVLCLWFPKKPLQNMAPPHALTTTAPATTTPFIGSQNAHEIYNTFNTYQYEGRVRPRQPVNTESPVNRTVRLPCRNSTTETLYFGEIRTQDDVIRPGETVLYVAERGWEMSPRLIMGDAKLLYDGQPVNETLARSVDTISVREPRIQITATANHSVPVNFTLKYTGVNVN